jgi:oligogalacturonide transport system substrate-binding protein
MVNEDYTLAFTEEDARQAFTLEKTGLDSGVFMPLRLVVPGQKVEHAKWQKGETGIIMGPTSVISAWAKGSPFEIGATLMPLRAGTANSGFEIRPPMIISVNARSKAQKDSVEFLKYFFTDETAVVTLGDVRGVPASEFARNILQKNHKLSPIMKEVTEKASAKPGLPLIPLHFNAELVKIFDDLVEGVGYGKLTPEQAAADLIRQYTDKLKELKSRPR